MELFRIGLDVGSTTAKVVVVNKSNDIVFSKYERHNANALPTVSSFIKEIVELFRDGQFAITFSGSVGMGISEHYKLPFVQEVVAASEYVKTCYPATSVVIDIGGEDAKIIYFNPNGNYELRMNGNCSGGTGAFIDQMALILNISNEEMNEYALKATHIHPIASRCGVFSKTDIQNLISKNANKADICASIFHAVSVQTSTTLFKGNEDFSQLLLLGGPLTFLPALRKAFINHLHLTDDNIVKCENTNLFTAIGAAQQTSTACDKLFSEKELSLLFDESNTKISSRQKQHLAPIFKNKKEYSDWIVQKNNHKIDDCSIEDCTKNVFLGIDSGSTTTKIVVIDEENRLVFSRYLPNKGNPIETVKEGLNELKKQCADKNIELHIKGSCSTGYGEDLIKTAFNLDTGIVETIGHYIAAKEINPNVSFILDIGGQDMKAIFIADGAIYRIEINEACSSGCGSFIETFANSLNYAVADFARIATESKKPCDLGTRCTVFMNSRVKQALREGASVADISAGLAYSVIKNCLYKVLKIKDTQELGDTIVVQGGTMRNDSIVRTLELSINKEVFRSNIPELMGAYGCALFAKAATLNRTVTLDELLNNKVIQKKAITCNGCENNCYISRYEFNEKLFYSGNKCEKVFSNSASTIIKGQNAIVAKRNLLFNRQSEINTKNIRIGIPRSLNTFENYPFWHTLLTKSGLNVVLSEQSSFKTYEKNVHSIMSDNICFPAKLVHSHIANLIEKQVDRILFPYVIFEQKADKKAVNSYNCPLVTGYSDVIKSAMEPNIPIDATGISFKTKKETIQTSSNYLKTLGVEKKHTPVIKAAIAEQEKFELDLAKINSDILEKSRENGNITILLAGRPYHADLLIQHKLSEMICDMGVSVITDDIVRTMEDVKFDEVHHVSQWAYVNRIIKAAQWVAEQGNDLQYVQITSFGCGPDAFLIDQIQQILKQKGKNATIIKLDDINNIGSMKLRIRSLIESISLNTSRETVSKAFITTTSYSRPQKNIKCIVPAFSSFTTPLIPPLFRLFGFDVDVLPLTDKISIDTGLQYANNEVCYPATIVVGDIIKGLNSGNYDINNTIVIITQTGGQCRATNYLGLLKQGMVDAGFDNVPIVSIGGGNGIGNSQEGFKINWLKAAPIALHTILFCDVIAKLYYPAVVREKEKGSANRLKNIYLEKGAKLIENNKASKLVKLMEEAVTAFSSISQEKDCPQVGIVGEIFLKFNNFANKDIENWLIERDIEIVPPNLTNFFMQNFVNSAVKKDANIGNKAYPKSIRTLLYKLISKQIKKVNRIGAKYPYFNPFTDIYNEARHGEKVVSLLAQFGEGWLLPAEIMSYAETGVNHVISLQPFGCIANHIVSKGVENKIKKHYPKLSLLSIDFDSGISDVNMENRLLLFVNNISPLPLVS